MVAPRVTVAEATLVAGFVPGSDRLEIDSALDVNGSGLSQLLLSPDWPGALPYTRVRPSMALSIVGCTLAPKLNEDWMSPVRIDGAAAPPRPTAAVAVVTAGRPPKRLPAKRPVDAPITLAPAACAQVEACVRPDVLL